MFISEVTNLEIHLIIHHYLIINILNGHCFDIFWIKLILNLVLKLQEIPRKNKNKKQISTQILVFLKVIYRNSSYTFSCNVNKLGLSLFLTVTIFMYQI